MIDKEKKAELIKDFKINDQDTGSAQVQAALLTEDILKLTEHTKQNPKDFSTKRGLLAKVNRRRKLLSYIKQHSEAMYRDMIKRLGLRK